VDQKSVDYFELQ